MRTHPVDKLLEQHCYKSAASLLQLVRFYVCIYWMLIDIFTGATTKGSVSDLSQPTLSTFPVGGNRRNPRIAGER
jgi:hypothetical protein